MHRASFDCKIVKVTTRPGSNGRGDFVSIAAVIEGRPRSAELEDENGRPLFTLPTTWISWIHPGHLTKPNPQDEILVTGFPYLSPPSKDGGVFLNLGDVSSCVVTRPAPVASGNSKAATAQPKAKAPVDSNDVEPM